MAKGITKKNNRRLKRQIRKTVGGLLMASAIVVAALPVPDVSANPEENASAKIKVAVLDSQQSETGSTSPFNGASSPYTSKIPHACERTDSPEEQIVYTSGDGTYQFVYMRPTTNDTNKVAVILGYNSGPLQDSTLTIPETLEAYRKYTDNVTSRGYCLVSKNDEFLHYETLVQKKDENDRKLYKVINYYDENHVALQVNQDELYLMEDGTWQYRVADGFELDENGNETTKVHYVYYKVDPVMEKQYNPCYYEQKEQWKNILDKDLYYSVKNSAGEISYYLAGDDSNHWKINADVAYIGAEKITDNNGVWSLAGDITSPSEGVFAEENNITNLIVGENIRGISDYAFYGCSTLKSVTLANGLDTIGNGAFANCINLQSCNIASNANIVAIGKDAFYNCRALTSFTVPIGLRALGDNCFEGCSALTSVNFGDGSSNVALQELGYHLFKGCSSLASIEFPSSYEENDLDIDMFEGCSSLQYIKIPNDKINIGKFHDGTGEYPDCSFAWESTKDPDGTITKIGFKDTVPDSFYFEGPASSDIHDTATENSVAFKYLNQDLYEKIEYEHDAVKDASNPNGKSAKVTYQVNSNNELVKFWINSGDKPDNVTIPETIGPYGISSIGEGSFTNNCDLIRITIPASVTSIGDNAFKGCHNLKTVIFTNASTIQSIGSNAFKTQEATCGDNLYPSSGVSKPELTFVGAMMNDAGNDTVPFIYAMNGVSNINNSNQEKIWITCHSGWPTNLEVQYNYDPISNTGEAQLIGYPRYEMIKDTGSATEWVSNLPYVTDQNKQEYLGMVTRATDYYQATDEEKRDMTQPTENEMAIVNSTLNVVIPTSVDSIKPGLFSGYVEDDESETGWEKVNNIKVTSGESVLSEESKPDTYIQRVVLNGVNEIEPYTFKNCTSLTEASIIGPTYIDDYAFDGLDDDENVQFESGVPTTMQLQTVTLGTNLTDTGKRPFRGCEKLTSVICLDSDFAYNNGIIYRNTGSGTEIVECLESRGAVGGIGSYSVGPDELAGVTTIKEEAFADCDDVGKVDLSATTIDAIPEGCFKETDDLNSVVLPDTVKNIEADSFINSGIRLLTIPGSQAYIARDAFKNEDKQQTIIFECIEGTTADRYAKAEENWYINPEYGKVYLEHTVYFWDYPDYPDTSNKELFYKVKVKDGDDAVPPTETPSHQGYPFSRWTDYTNVTRDIDVYPVFGANVYAVTFLSYDGSTIGEVQYVEEGKSAIPPTPPVRDGYTFDKWSQDWNNITEDRNIVALYTDNSGDASRHQVIFYDYDGTTIISKQSVNDGEAAVEPKSPTRSGYTFIGWVPSDFSKVEKDLNIVANYEKNTSSGSGGSSSGSGGGSGSGGSSSDSKASASPSASPSGSSASPEVTKYTVSVSGGSGSGSYPAGAVVAINAYFLGEGQNFDKWTTSTAGVGFANPNASSTTFTMPAANVAVTATYKTGSGSSGSTGGSGSSSGGSGGSSATNANSGSTVQVTKPGISNTGLAGATVSGATDNFIIKVSEDQSAADAAVAALQAKYGDLSRIKYFPMDISLYDSTGRTKIADTSGISVNITLPLPDELVQYAGNNRIAAVSNGSLEDLSARFTTIDGVPCINFTATHFSPYVIYVDTANLTAGTIDTTPKTGDPIHPKWFLAIGMACISLILFFKKEKTVVRPKSA